MASKEPQQRRMSPHFFQREADGSVRLRIRLSAEEASLIEEGAGTTPLMLYIHRVLKERAEFHIKKREQAEQAGQAMAANGTQSKDSDGSSEH